MSDVSPNQSIANRYRILNLIGQGGMGTVYRATDRLYGNVVALKRVRVAASETNRVRRGKSFIACLMDI